MKTVQKQHYEDVRPMLFKILTTVSNVTGVSEDDICKPNGKTKIRDATNLFYYAARLQGITTTNIALFLKRDHSTILSGSLRYMNLTETETGPKVMLEKVQIKLAI